MLNSVHLLGRLAQDPELRYTQTGTAVTSFDLAVQVPSKEKNTPPEYLPIVCWAQTAELVGRYLSKGRQIIVDGRLTTRKYTDNDGKTRKVVEVTASRILFADSNNGGGDNGSTDQSDNYAAVPDVDDVLPF
ncbi:MAG: single-stranded DNA-binding protein [Paludibacteraceae bacterium]|nr:single-stranded DNA-binding protein [Paludibacteraceae bacterium]